MKRDEFAALYAAAFGELPDVWYDSRCLRADSLLRRFGASDVFSAERDGERALLYRQRRAPLQREQPDAELLAAREVVCRASPRALGALEFIAGHDGLLVRELPGLRTLDERLALCRPLVRYEVLRVCI